MKKILWIEFRQEVTYSVGLEIDEDLSLEEADRLIEELNDRYPADSDDDDVEKYVRPYATENYANDWDDFEDVNVYIKEYPKQ
jgi:hypothetical protein